MRATITDCAGSVSPSEQPRLAAPHVVHVRVDSFVINCETGQTPCFRIRRTPAPFDDLRIILESFTPAVDIDSTSGFYLNFFGSPLLHQDFPGTLRRLQLEVLKRTGIKVSIGAATYRIAAAVASRIENPGGVRLIAPNTEAAFLASLPVEVLHGLNHLDARDLRNRGIATIASLQRVPRAALAAIYGDDRGSQIWRNARALDAIAASARPVATSAWNWLRLAAASVVAAL